MKSVDKQCRTDAGTPTPVYYEPTEQRTRNPTVPGQFASAVRENVLRHGGESRRVAIAHHKARFGMRQSKTGGNSTARILRRPFLDVLME